MTKLKDRCLALRLDNDGLRYIMLSQDCRRYLDSKRPGDTVEGYSCPTCIGLETYFPKIHRLKRKYYETWPFSAFRHFWPEFGPFGLGLAYLVLVVIKSRSIGSHGLFQGILLFLVDHRNPSI